MSVNTYFLFKFYAYIESKTRKVEDKSETGIEDESKVGGSRDQSKVVVENKSKAWDRKQKKDK